MMGHQKSWSFLILKEIIRLNVMKAFSIQWEALQQPETMIKEQKLMTNKLKTFKKSLKTPSAKFYQKTQVSPF